MTTSVYSFLDGHGRLYRVLLHRVAPNAYGGGGSPPQPSYGICQYDNNCVDNSNHLL